MGSALQRPVQDVVEVAHAATPQCSRSDVPPEGVALSIFNEFEKQVLLHKLS
jgi:hypothetical protein